MRKGTNERTYTTTKHITTLLLRSRVKNDKIYPLTQCCQFTIFQPVRNIIVGRDIAPKNARMQSGSSANIGELLHYFAQRCSCLHSTEQQEWSRLYTRQSGPVHAERRC